MLSPRSKSKARRRLRPRYTAAAGEYVTSVFKVGTERLATSSAMGALSALANGFFAALHVLSCRAAGVLDRFLALVVIFLSPLNGTVPRSPSTFPGFILGSRCVVPQHASQFSSSLGCEEQRQSSPDEGAGHES